MYSLADCSLDGLSAWMPENVVGLLASKPVIASAASQVAAAQTGPPLATADHL